MFKDRKKLVMCQVCRGLIDSSVKTCPLCGRESVPPIRISAANVTESGNFFSLVILTINIVLFVLMSIVEVRNGGGGESFVKQASNGVLDDFGALVPALVRQGQWWRLVTFNFLHIGLMHLMFNSSALFSIGPQVEGIFGSQKFVFAYLGTGTFSAFASFLLLPQNSAGASGAIFGLIGLMAVYGYRQGGSFGRALMRQMLIWAGIGFMIGFFIGANNVAHAGGFVAGAALGFVLEPDAPTTATSALRWNATAIACIGVVAISFVFAGRAYGSEQERDAQRDVAARRLQSAQHFERAIKDAREAVIVSYQLAREPKGPSKQDAIETAAELKRVGAQLASTTAIDDQSNAIKAKLGELLAKRAKAFEEATDSSSIAKAISADDEAFASVFQDYSDWATRMVKEFDEILGK